MRERSHLNNQPEDLMEGLVFDVLNLSSEVISKGYTVDLVRGILLEEFSEEYTDNFLRKFFDYA